MMRNYHLKIAKKIQKPLKHCYFSNMCYLYNTYIKDNKLKSQKTWNPSEQKPSTSKNIWDPDNLPNWGDEIPF